MPAIADKVIVTLPHLFKPRDKQFSFLRAMDGGMDRAVLVWHRRYGKDTVCFNHGISNSRSFGLWTPAQTALSWCGTGAMARTRFALTS